LGFIVVFVPWASIYLFISKIDHIPLKLLLWLANTKSFVDKRTIKIFPACADFIYVEKLKRYWILVYSFVMNTTAEGCTRRLLVGDADPVEAELVVDSILKRSTR